MKILQTPPRIFTAGGVERYVGDLSRELVKRGHRVKILCAKGKVHPEGDQNLEILPLSSIGTIGNTPITPTLPLHLWKQDFDILHTHLPTPWSSDWSSIIARQKDRPLVITFHSSITGRGFTRIIADLYNRTALRHLLRSAERIIITRPAYIPEQLRFFQEKIACIPIGVDISRFYPDEQEISAEIFFLSVLDEFHGFKGLDTLMAAIQLVKRKIPGIRLVIGGGGQKLPYYVRMAETMGLSENIRFTGFIPEERLKDYYNRSRLFVLPSRSPELETFGIVLLEAMACGRPVVATKIAGLADDITRSCSGTIVEPDDPGELATAILTILQDESLEQSMGENGRMLVREKYLWPVIAGRIEQLYKDIR